MTPFLWTDCTDVSKLREMILAHAIIVASMASSTRTFSPLSRTEPGNRVWASSTVQNVTISEYLQNITRITSASKGVKKSFLLNLICLNKVSPLFLALLHRSRMDDD